MRGAVVIAALCLTTGCAEHVLWRGHTADRTLEIRVVESGGQQRVRVGGREQPGHSAVGVDALALAGRRVAYPARDGKSWQVVVDGTATGGAWDAIGAVAWAPDGERVEYAAVSGGHWFVVDGRETSAPLDAVAYLDFDALGRSVYVGKSGSHVRVYVGGRGGPEWDEVRWLTARPSIRYVGVGDDGEHVVDGTTVSPAYDAVVEMVPGGYIGRTKTGREVTVAGRVVARGELHRLAAARGHYAFVRRGPTFEVAVRDGAEDPRTWDSIDSLSLSSDGSHWGYVARQSGMAVVVVDGVERGRWARARAPVFAERGGEFGYVASMGAGAVVVTSTSRHAFDVLLEDSLVLDEDGAHWAAVGGFDSVRRLYRIVDGTPRRRFDLDEWLCELIRRSPLDAGARLRGWLTLDLQSRAAR